ncbi:MAG: hypothetical protein WC496_08465 [Phycisphaerae bacterium]|jgi:hypothetical protein
MKTRLTVVLIITLLLCAVCVATPIYGTVTMSQSGYGAKDTMTIWGGGWNGLNVSAGVFLFNKTAGTGEGQYIDNGLFSGFCMDLSEYTAPGTLTYDVLKVQDGPRPTAFLGGSMGQAKADYLAELWGRFYNPAWAATGSYTSQQKNEAGAFAAAVWEIIYEDLPTSSAGWDVTSDGTGGSRGFKATNLDSQKANDWLHALDGTGPMADLRSLSYLGAQDFLVAVDTGAIPEPATLAFVAFGFLMVVSKKNSAKTA